ncbi:histidine kinase [Solwaraspora sp. WMMD1047]|uniref:sensor histidine kinase n=1 Tax=Solwaraspora sp. WMMD1047 TaxID=3016102 RepID=UPI0024161FF1|nr:histidine kinase [Solwaraspora sp. WMMD1047]MDG4831830.1 histidine kinase [Solwaraspora sp. WMMD1047]
MDDRTDLPRAALRDLRRLLVGLDEPRPAGHPPARWRRLLPLIVPVGLFVLLSLTFAAYEYLLDVRHLPPGMPTVLAVGSTLPVAVAARSPLWGWRLAYPMLFAGAVSALPTESWPWNPVQILGFLVVLASLAVRTDTGVVVWAAVLTLAPVFLVVPTRANAYGVTVLLAVVVILGDQVRRQRQSQQALAVQSEVSELEKARRAVLEERTRIARELHDVVAHHMSMIAVQAETAPYRLAALPDPARDEFTAIAASAREALTDMRRLLGVLRSETSTAQTAPQPGLDDVPDLVEAARRAGMTVTLEQDRPPPGAPTPPEAVGLTAYRIVQEALANAARHAPGTSVRVSLRPGVGELALRVENGAHPAPARPAGPAGHGLTGMRERARLLAGTFSAGPVDGGGFAVVAHLPYGTAQPLAATDPRGADADPPGTDTGSSGTDAGSSGTDTDAVERPRRNGGRR